jgi:hypothetical protein
MMLLLLEHSFIDYDNIANSNCCLRNQSLGYWRGLYVVLHVGGATEARLHVVGCTLFISISCEYFAL